MQDKDWVKDFIERYAKESAGIPQFMRDAYALPKQPDESKSSPPAKRRNDNSSNLD